MSTTSQGATGPASIELAYELHRLLAAELVARMKASPSADLLAVVRAFLKDQGHLDVPTDDKARKKLERLHRLLVERLLEAVTAGIPSASVMSEARRLLLDQGIHKDLGGAVDTAKALQLLSAAHLPFRTQ